MRKNKNRWSIRPQIVDDPLTGQAFEFRTVEGTSAPYRFRFYSEEGVIREIAFTSDGVEESQVEPVRRNRARDILLRTKEQLTRHRPVLLSERARKLLRQALPQWARHKDAGLAATHSPEQKRRRRSPRSI